MHRVLLVESSPTLRRGMERLLLRHGYAVAAVPADERALRVFEHQMAGGLVALVFGWSDAPAEVRDGFTERLLRPDVQGVAALVLTADPAQVAADLAAHRPHTHVVRMQRPTEVPGLLRSLIEAAQASDRPRSETPGLKVLLVDDSRTSRTKYQRLLQSRGHEVVCCEHAEAALARVQTDRFDLAVIDYFMPGMNGAMLCRALRAQPATQDLTLTVLTGSYDDGLISDCLEAGAVECMFKNESDGLFLARVDSMARLREREQRLKDEHHRLELILSSVGDGVYGVDRRGRITFVNPAALRLLQRAHEDELVGLSAHEVIHHSDERGRPVPGETCFLQQAYELGDSLSNWETVFWRQDGEMLNVECTVRPLHQSAQQGGACVGVVVAFRDIAERKREEAETQWQLHHDHLTKLHNRRHFEYMLEQELFRLRRSVEQSALLFIDLDRFKHINDTAGHAAGDALLAHIGRKLKSRARQSDLVARLGGDEFVVLLRQVDDVSLLNLAEKFRAILDDGHFAYGGREFVVSGSVGVVRLNRHTLSPAYAVNCADAACHIAKREGRNRIHLFDLGGDAGALATLQQSWSERLKAALVADGFALQFQPIYSLPRLPEDTSVEAPPEALYGHEVFLRLDDVDSLLSPRAFLSQAERFELMPALDGWVLDQVAQLLRHRQRPLASHFHLNVAVSSLLDSHYLARLDALMGAAVFAPGQLCLELKESELAGQLAALTPVLNELHRLGVRLLLDEYGRGFGGLGHLRGLPLSAVKLDGGLVQGLASDEVGVLMVRAMADLAHAMQATVIAPLIEDPVVLQRLRNAGVDQVQGFVLGEPSSSWPELMED